MNLIAGHTFVETPRGRRCSGCDRAWVDIAGVQPTDIERSGFAHTGVLSEPEYRQIVAERERLWELGKL